MIFKIRHVRYSLVIYFYNMEHLWSSENLDTSPHGIWRRMNIHVFYIFSNHCIAVEKIDVTDILGFHFHHLEIWPLNLPEPSHLKIVKESIWNVSSLSISSNCWTGFLTGQDFFGLLWTGTKLPIHSVLLEVNRSLEKIESGICTIDHVSENGDISIDLHEESPTLMKGYQITTKRKRLQKLK